jgi:uncharacterized membrane protein YhaH (DUF805 family)
MSKVLASFKSFYRLATTGKGRSSRFDYWVGTIFVLVMGTAQAFLVPHFMTKTQSFGSVMLVQESRLGVQVLTALFAVLLGVPFIFLNIRRAHDFGVTGWLYLPFFVLSKVSVFASLVGIIIFGFIPSKDEGNKYTNDNDQSRKPVTSPKRVIIIIFGTLGFIVATGVIISFLASRQ